MLRYSRLCITLLALASFRGMISAMLSPGGLMHVSTDHHLRADNEPSVSMEDLSCLFEVLTSDATVGCLVPALEKKGNNICSGTMEGYECLVDQIKKNCTDSGVDAFWSVAFIQIDSSLLSNPDCEKLIDWGTEHGATVEINA